MSSLSGDPLATNVGTGADPILEVQDLSKNFGGFYAVRDVSMSVLPGEIRAIIGPNGAGKSTLFSLAIGEIRPTAGRVLLAGRDVTGMATHRIMKRGMGCAFQATSVFWRLSVRECLEVAVSSAQRSSGRLFGSFRPSVRVAVAELVDQVGLGGLEEVASRDLSHGDQRALEVALALAPRPSVLLLDEPTAGMSPGETSRAVSLIRQLAREAGLSVVLVEHDVEVVFSVADRITVMHQGQIIAEGLPADIRRNEDVIAVYLGNIDSEPGSR